MDPEEHIASIAAAGAHRIVFQWESLLHDPHAEGDAAQAQRAAAVQRARALVERIQAAGCSAGVCIAPETSAEVIGGARHEDQP